MHASLPFMRQILQFHQQCTGHISHISTLQHLPVHAGPMALRLLNCTKCSLPGSFASWRAQPTQLAPPCALGTRAQVKPMPLCPWRMAVKPRLPQSTKPKGVQPMISMISSWTNYVNLGNGWTGVRLLGLLQHKTSQMAVLTSPCI